VLDFDSNEYPFSRIFREALLASDSQSNANCKKEKREQRFAVMQEFRQRLRYRDTRSTKVYLILCS
jgi:hypothetical protein